MYFEMFDTSCRGLVSDVEKLMALDMTIQGMIFRMNRSASLHEVLQYMLR